MKLIEDLKYFLQFDFVKYALIVGGLISLCCAILGVTLVLKRYSMIGDGLSHVAFGAMTLAMVLTIVDMYVMLPVTILVAILLIRLTDKGKVKNDSAIAMLSVGALAVGYMIVSLFSSSANISGDVCSSLFGLTSILTLSNWEVWFCLGITVFLVIFFVIFHNKIFTVTFDENFSTATGVKSALYNNIIAIIISK